MFIISWVYRIPVTLEKMLDEQDINSMRYYSIKLDVFDNMGHSKKEGKLTQDEFKTIISKLENSLYTKIYGDVVHTWVDRELYVIDIHYDIEDDGHYIIISNKGIVGMFSSNSKQQYYRFTDSEEGNVVVREIYQYILERVK